MYLWGSLRRDLRVGLWGDPVVLSYHPEAFGARRGTLWTLPGRIPQWVTRHFSYETEVTLPHNLLISRESYPKWSCHLLFGEEIWKRDAKFSWINEKLQQLKSNYKREKTLKLKSSFCLKLGSLYSSKKWILFSIDQVNIKLLQNSSPLIIDGVAQLLCNEISVDTLKMQNSQTTLQLVWTISNLSTFIKDKSQTSWRPVFTHLRGTKQRLGLCWSSEVDKARLLMKRPK